MGKARAHSSICAMRFVRVSLRYSVRSRPALSQHIGCDDELAALVFAAPYVISRVLHRTAFRGRR